MPDSTQDQVFTEIALFKGADVLPDGTVVTPEEDARRQAAQSLAAAAQKFTLLLPVANIELTPEEARRVSTFQEATLILGAAGRSPMYCEGEWVIRANGTDGGCPFAGRCPLVRMNKAPVGQLCPFEANYVTQRWVEWLQEIGRTPQTVTASERAAVSTLVTLDLQEMRCNHVLAEAQQATMQSRSVRDVNAESGEPIAWELVVHINAQRLDQILVQRRMILKDFELTPEAKTRRAKALGLKAENDLATQQSSAFDQLRNARKRTVTVEASPVRAR